MASKDSAQPLLEVEGLAIEFPTANGWVKVVDNLSFGIRHGETLGIVGESGSGKSVTSLAVAGLLPLRGGRIAGGSVRFNGAELTRLGSAEMQKLRGSKIGMIFQQPTRCLNPAYTIGQQISEVMRLHEGISREEGLKRATALLDRVGIARAAQRVDDYPHQFSGGMCQRVMIAMALAGRPELLIADEPTTALDVTIQARILALLREIQREERMALMLITHDLGVVAEQCERLVVMHAGQVLETGRTSSVLRDPRHPYTAGLLATVQMRREGGQLITIPGTAPRPGQVMASCRFVERCAYRTPGVCDLEMPPMVPIAEGRAARCLRVGQLKLEGI